MKNTTEAGREAEIAAENYYHRQGFSTLGRNFRTRRGELDLILRKGPLLLFVEVKGRTGGWEQHAWLESWGRKARRLHGAIRVFLARHPDLEYEQMRLEIVFVTQGRVSARFGW